MKKLDIDLQKLKNQYNIVGKNKALDTALLTAVQVAPTDLSVLIEGENGVGKEIIPRIIHDLSPCKNKKYLAINCGSIPEGTIDSELFGHEKGAFTNAISEHEGYFGAADGGTLFLDEIGELPMSTQARLLRVLETGEYIRVGSNSIRKTIIAATNINIPNAIREGKFRQDLYYRLCRVNITMPPLRERNDDAVLLFKKFAMDMATKYQMPEYIHLTPAAEEVVKSYKWPGNIRQLKNVVEQMSVLSEERSITPEVLAKFGIVPNSDSEMGITITGSRSSESQHDYEKEIKMLAHAVLQLRNEVEELKQKIQGGEPSNLPATTKVPTTTPAYSHQVPNISPTIPQNPIPATDMEFQTAEEVLEDDTLNINDMEKRNIIKSLQRNHYRRKDAADELGISVRTLYRKLKAYGIEE